MPNTDHHRLLIDHAIRWQRERDVKVLQTCADSTSGDVSQYLSTLVKFLDYEEPGLQEEAVQACLQQYNMEPSHE